MYKFVVGTTVLRYASEVKTSICQTHGLASVHIQTAFVLLSVFWKVKNVIEIQDVQAGKFVYACVYKRAQK